MPMGALDSLFLLGESREHPTHIGALQLFEPPPDAGPEYVSDFYRELLTHTEVSRLMRRRPVRGTATLGQFAWEEDTEIELEYHVRLSALPRPGRVRELLELVSRLHGTLMDRHRPLWEMHVVEGLADGRFAIYTKVHHSLMDGVSTVKRLHAGLGSDPKSKSRPFWAPSGRSKRSRGGQSDNGSSGIVDMLTKMLTEAPKEAFDKAQSAVKLAGQVAAAPPAVARALISAYADSAASLPFEAPRTMLNVPIGGARRFAAQSWSIDRLQQVGKSVDATINDVAVAMCAGALRRYLSEQGELPDKSLVAMLPVSLRSSESGSGSDDDTGNAVGAVLCDLATDQADPAVRLSRVRASTRHAKAMLSGMSPIQIMAMTSAVSSGVALGSVGLGQLLRPPFNLIISNVPGGKDVIYWNGAKLVGTYPLSIPFEGQALNITLTSYAGQASFGVTGCRRSVPHLQRLLPHLGAELDDLEKAVL